jgi:glycine hydroxymethyltransferase
MKGMPVDQSLSLPLEAVRGIAEAASMNERYRLTQSVNLVASQNRISPQAIACLSSSFAAKFASGELGSRAHGGAKWLDAMEEIVASLAGKLFHPYFPEYRPMSGSLANETLLMAFARPGDTIIAPSPVAGGHASLRPEGFAGFMGLRVLDLPFSDGGMTIDLDGLRALAAREKPKLIIIGTAKILFPYPVDKVVEIARSVDAEVIYDGAHVAGLIAGKSFQNPLDAGALAFTGSTQKTFPGPIGGLIVSRDLETAERVRAVTRVRLDNYQNNRVAAMGVVFAEMLTFGHELTGAVVSTAQKLAVALSDEGIDVVGRALGYTQSHMLLANTTPIGPAAGFRSQLEAIGIFTTATDIWSEDGKPRTALRIGANDIARLGYSDEDIKVLAGLIADVVFGRRDQDAVRGGVIALADQYPGIDPRFAL